MQATRVDPYSQNPVVKLPQKAQPKRARACRVRVIHHYRFYGCSWVWC